VSSMGIQSDTPKPVSQEDDDARQRAVLAALVEAGDLPRDVLSAWDGDGVIEGVVVEEED
jgi:hypothetical protein